MEISKDKLYIEMLEEILAKKDIVLDELLRHTMEQEGILKKDKFDNGAFIIKIREKDKLIKRLNELDQGFEMLYQKVKEELAINKYQYQDKIKKIQDLIQVIVEKGMQLRSLEMQNQNLFNFYLSNERSKIGEFKINKKVASNYYKSVAKLQTQESYFLDSKR